MATSWKGITVDWRNDAFRVNDNEEKVCCMFVGEPDDVKTIQKHLISLRDSTDRLKSIPEFAEAIEKLGLKFCTVGAVLPGYVEDEEDNY